MDIKEILRDLDVDMKARLTTFTSNELGKLLSALTKSMNKQTLAGLICDDNYFNQEHVVKALDKMGGKKSKLRELLGEPKDEAQMRESVGSELRAKKYRISYEVPLPKKGRGRQRKVDVAGYKKGLLGGISIIGVELKSQTTRGAIDQAFGQAKDYSEWCEESAVGFSPLVYLKYSDVIENKMKKERNLGVWIVSKRKIVRVLQDASALSVSDKKQKEMVEFIESGRR